jgi:tripartite-type tricarboxylate transporter receptor subunit TctC
VRDAGPSKRVTGAGAHTASSKGKEEGEVHLAPAPIDKAVHAEQFTSTLANVGQELDYLDGPDFQRFWDTDGERTDAAVKAIGRQG